MSSGPVLERDPAREDAADRETQLGAATRVLTGVLTFSFRVGLALRRLVVGVVTIVLLPLAIAKSILVALVGRSTRSRIIALVTVGIFLWVALVVIEIALPSSHSDSYPVFVILATFFGDVLLSLLALGLLILVATPVVALAKLARRALHKERPGLRAP